MTRKNSVIPPALDLNGGRVRYDRTDAAVLAPLKSRSTGNVQEGYANKCNLM